MQVTTIGLDIAKNVFQVHGIDSAEKVVVRKQLRRSQVLEFFKALPPCLIGMEACATAHYWARELTKLGHQVRLMPAKDVKAYVKRNKNDAADAELPSLSRATPSAVSEHSSELIGCPISRSLTTYCVRLELRPLPSTGVIRLQRYCEPLRRPRAPDLSLAGVRLVIADHALGLPVLRALSLCTCCRHYPGAAAGRLASLASPSRVSLPRYGGRVGLRIVLFEVCSAFTALRPAHSRCHRIS